MEPWTPPRYIPLRQEFFVTSRLGSSSKAFVAAVTAGAMLAVPAIALAAGSQSKPPAVSVSFNPLTSFTPANADPRLAASFGKKVLGLTDFKFTPAPAKGRPSQVRVAIRARTNSQAEATMAAAKSPIPVTALTPASYNLGVGVGWRRFAVAADVGETKPANPSLGGRETAVVGVSYSLSKKLTGRVAVGADRGDERALPALRQADEYSVDLGGAFNITRNIAVTGGVRYSVEHDRLATVADQRRDSQAVYVGTAVKF